MNRIELRGVIVPSEYDSSWAEGYIAKGIIIPESRFRSMLASANKKEPLTVYVNSPGGSVFAAGEMVNAVREWKAETGQPVTVVLGALTASAASAFAIMVADQIKAHSNAKMMFHGAWTVSVGGAEMHGDTAELLEKINADIKTRLVSKYGMSPETVTEWFSEGREGWLSASDLVDAKLASEIISDASDVIEFESDALGEIEDRGLGIAAFLKTNTESEINDEAGETDSGDESGNGDGDTAPDREPTDADEPAAVDEPAPDSDQPAAAGSEQPSAIIAEPVADVIEAARQEARQAALQESGEVILSLRSKLATEQETARKLQSERDQLRAANDKAVSALTKANDHIQRLLNGGLSFSASIENWQQALAECKGDYEEARRKYPDAYRAQREQDKTSRK
jgi:ATP-dependent protease ClpP protease subunit